MIIDSPLARMDNIIIHSQEDDICGGQPQGGGREIGVDLLAAFWQPLHGASYFDHARSPGRQNIIYYKSHAPVTQGLAVLLRGRDIVSTTINRLMLRVVAKAHRHN